MPRLIALEWDAREARIAVARTRGSDVVMDQAFAVELAPSDPGQTFADVNVGQRIAAALAARGIGRSETLVAVGRASIELRQLSVPHVPAEELSDVVRFQALRQFTAIAEDWPLDYVQLDTGESGNLSVLAAAISPEMVEQIRQTCRAGELTPKRLILRPFAAASLLCRRDRGGSQPPRLMVDMLADEADLTVLVDEQVALMRTVRLSAAADGAQAKALLGEIRRTIASAQNQLGGQRIQKVILCGDGGDQTTLKSVLESELSYEVELFDPFDELQLGRELQQRPEHAGRFAPLIGMLLDEAAAAAHAIDFLHPRKKPVAPSQGRRGIFIGGILAAAALAVAAFFWLQLTAMDDEILLLTTESARLKSKVKQAEQYRRDVAAVNEFLDNDIGWLDELYELSSRLPSAEDVVVTQITLSTRPPAGGQVIVDGHVRESHLMGDLQESLRWNQRQVISTGVHEDPRQQTYRHRFKETQLIEPGRIKAAAKTQEPPEAEVPQSASDKERTSR